MTNIFGKSVKRNVMDHHIRLRYGDSELLTQINSKSNQSILEYITSAQPNIYCIYYIKLFVPTSPNPTPEVDVNKKNVSKILTDDINRYTHA